jgi:hypothetical protein
MLGKFYKGHHILGTAMPGKDPGHWTPGVTIFPPVRISHSPTTLTGSEGSFATKEEAEAEGVRMGKEWVDRQPS